MKIFVFDRVENIAEKGENAGYRHFLLLLQCFKKPSPLRLLKSLYQTTQFWTGRNSKTFPNDILNVA